MAFTPMPSSNPLIHRWLVDPEISRSHLYDHVFASALKTLLPSLSANEKKWLVNGFCFVYGRFTINVDKELSFEASVLDLKHCNFDDHRGMCQAIARERILCQLDVGNTRHLLWCPLSALHVPDSVFVNLIMRDRYCVESKEESEEEMRTVEQETSVIVLRHVGWRALHNPKAVYTNDPVKTPP